MTPAELLQERASSLLELMKDSSLRHTIPNLAACAKRAWPTLSERDRDAIANAALRVHTGGSVTGEGPLPTGPDGHTNADWPVRTVARPQAEPPQMPAAASTKSPAAPAADVDVILDALRKLIPTRPEMTSDELYDALGRQGIQLCARSTFVVHHVRTIRKELGISGAAARAAGHKAFIDKGGKPGPAKASTTPKKPEPPRASAPASANGHAAAPPAPPRPPARTATPPLPPARPVSNGASTVQVNGAARDTSGRDVIRISGGGDSFESTRQADGSWKVSLEASVTEELMGQLAAIAWGGIMGAGAPA